MTYRATLLFGLVSAISFVACSGPTPAATPLMGVATPPGWEGTAGPVEPIPVTIGLPFRPDVQFAPIYVAIAHGEFASRGLDVTVEYGDETDFLRSVAAGDMPAAIAGGDQVLLARAQSIPVTYVATWYHRFPVAVFSLNPALDRAAALAGHTVGEPMPGGVTALGLRALLAAEGVAETDVTMEVIGFNQVDAVRSGQVDAAVGYAVNEPLRLRQENLDVTVIEVADFANLVGNGLVVSEAMIRDSADVVQSLVDGLLAGIEATLAAPDEAFAIALDVVPEAADPTQGLLQRAILEESLRFWTSPTTTGAIDAAQWKASAATMLELGLLETEIDTAAATNGTFVARFAAR